MWVWEEEARGSRGSGGNWGGRELLMRWKSAVDPFKCTLVCKKILVHQYMFVGNTCTGLSKDFEWNIADADLIIGDCRVS